MPLRPKTVTTKAYRPKPPTPPKTNLGGKFTPSGFVPNKPTITLPTDQAPYRHGQSPVQQTVRGLGASGVTVKDQGATHSDAQRYAQTKALQRELVAHGFHVAVDGIMGPQTRAAYEKYFSRTSQVGAQVAKDTPVDMFAEARKQAAQERVQHEALMKEIAAKHPDYADNPRLLNQLAIQAAAGKWDMNQQPSLSPLVHAGEKAFKWGQGLSENVAKFQTGDLEAGIKAARQVHDVTGDPYQAAKALVKSSYALGESGFDPSKIPSVALNAANLALWVIPAVRPAGAALDASSLLVKGAVEQHGLTADALRALATQQGRGEAAMAGADLRAYQAQLKAAARATKAMPGFEGESAPAIQQLLASAAEGVARAQGTTRAEGMKAIWNDLIVMPHLDPSAAEINQGVLAQIERFYKTPEGKKLLDNARAFERAQAGAGAPPMETIYGSHGHPVFGPSTAAEKTARINYAVPDVAEQKQAAQWYHDLQPLFEKEFGADKADAYLRAFLASQANASPQGGLTSVLRAADALAKGEVPGNVGTVSKVRDNIVKAIKGEQLDSGFAMKLTDFSDSAVGTPTRAWHGDDPRFGEPVAADVWMGRSSGHLDEKLLAKRVALGPETGADRIRRLHGIDPEGLPQTNGLTDTIKEYIVKDSQDLAKHFNEIGFHGRNDWTASEAQALEWHAMQKFHGIPVEHPHQFVAKAKEAAARLIQRDAVERLRTDAMVGDIAAAQHLEPIKFQMEDWGGQDADIPFEGPPEGDVSPEAKEIARMLPEDQWPSWVKNQIHRAIHGPVKPVDWTPYPPKGGYGEVPDTIPEDWLKQANSPKVKGAFDVGARKVYLFQRSDESTLWHELIHALQGHMGLGHLGDEHLARASERWLWRGEFDGMPKKTQKALEQLSGRMRKIYKTEDEIPGGPLTDEISNGLKAFFKGDTTGAAEARQGRGVLHQEEVSHLPSEEHLAENPRDRYIPIFIEKDGRVVVGEPGMDHASIDPKGHTYETHGYAVVMDGKVEQVNFSDTNMSEGAKNLDKNPEVQAKVKAAVERRFTGGEGNLEGLPEGRSANPDAQMIAREYSQKSGIPYTRPTEYVKVDKERAARIAAWYDKAVDAPNDPAVRAAYDAMAKETLAQYNEIVANGYRFEFYPEGPEPYITPQEAMDDLRNNRHMFVFPTEGGFGSLTEAQKAHPLLADSGVKWGDKSATHNDIFRAVHDFFGHFKEGNGFRAAGEENAWRSHSAMYSDEARPAMTAETRGQNSWVNFGPHGEANRTASQAATVYADQKAVLAPEWVTREGAGDVRFQEETPGEAAAKAEGKYGMTKEQLDEAAQSFMRKAKPGRRAQDVSDDEERARRAARAEAALRDKTQPDPRQRQINALGELKGKLPIVDWQGSEELSSEKITAMMEHIQSLDKLGTYEKIRAAQTLERMLGDRPPTESEFRTLEKIFGKQPGLRSLKDEGSKWRRLLYEVLNIPRSIMASFDLSAPLRQGLVLGSQHPIIAGKAVGSMFKMFASEGFYANFERGLESRPNYDLWKRMDLAITDLEHAGGTEEGEEAFASNLAEKIFSFKPGTREASPIRWSGRAYTGFLVKLRTDVADHLLAEAQAAGVNIQKDEKFLRDLGNFINAATGRGQVLKKLEGSLDALNATFFSPRLMASRMNFLNVANPENYLRLDPFVRRQKILAALSTAGTVSSFLALASQIPGVTVGLNPRSADFAKIKVGDTRIDVAGGFQQYIRLFSEIGTMSTTSSTSGRTTSLWSKKYGAKTGLDVALGFLEGKAAPIAGVGLDVLRGKDAVGQPITWQNEVKSHTLPLIAQDMSDIAKDPPIKGMNPIAAAFLGYTAETFGTGVQTYKPKPAGAKGTAHYLDLAKKVGLVVPARVQEGMAHAAMLRSISSGETDKSKRLGEYLDYYKKVTGQSTFEWARKTTNEAQMAGIEKAIRARMTAGASGWERSIKARAAAKGLK